MESHRQTFQQIHRDRSVKGVPVPHEQLQDIAERSDGLFLSKPQHQAFESQTVQQFRNIILKVTFSTDLIVCPAHLMFT